jgi:hypothetical protein
MPPGSWPIQIFTPAGDTLAFGTNQANMATFSATGGATFPRGLVGVTDGSNAVAGRIGEVIASQGSVGYTGAAYGGMMMTSVALTPGDWDVSGNVVNAVNSVGAGAAFFLEMSTNSTITGFGSNGMFFFQSAAVAAANVALSTATMRYNVTVPTTVYLHLGATGAVTTAINFYYRLSARRMR